MAANPIPTSLATAEEARQALDEVERVVADLDCGAGLRDLDERLAALLSHVGEIAQAAVVGVPSAAATLMHATLGIAAALRQPAPDEDGILLALEEMRAGLLDLIESQPVRRDLPPGDLLDWLDSILASDRAELALVLGTSRRTLQRWLAQPLTIPRGAVPRLRLVARLVNELRFAYEPGPALCGWFLSPKRDLSGRRPVDVIDDPDAADRLTSLALHARFA